MSCLPTTITTQPRANSISRFVGAQEHRAALLDFGILLRRRDCWHRGPTSVGELPTAANELIGRGDDHTQRGVCFKQLECASDGQSLQVPINCSPDQLRPLTSVPSGQYS
jgi:hypothetical protein